MKKFFTLIAATFVAVAVSAKTYTFGGLTGDKFTYDETEFTYGTTSDLMFDYVKKDKANYSALSLKDSPISFLYKNSGAKTKFYQLYEKNLIANGKGSQIKFDGLTVGATVKISIGSKGSTASAFAILEGFEGDIPTFEPKDEDYVYQTITLKATATTAIISETDNGFALESIEIVEASEGGDTPAAGTWTQPIWEGVYNADTEALITSYDLNATITCNGDGTYTIKNILGGKESVTFTIQSDGTLIISDPAADKGYNYFYIGDPEWYDFGAYTTTYNGYKYSWTTDANGTYYATTLDETKGEIGFYGSIYNRNDSNNYPWSYYCASWDKEKAAAAIQSAAIAPASSAIYDLQGRKLNVVPAKGMYIKGGKKYLVK